MDFLTDLIQIVLPALIVFLTAYFILRSYLQGVERSRAIDLKFDHQKVALPLRLQAYERLALFLERIQPESLVMRVNQPGMNAFQMQTTMIQTVRMEFDHNLSQQVYISNEAWEVIKSAKEETIKLINTAATKVNADAMAIDLGSMVLEESLRVEKSACYKALVYLKEEVRQYLA